MQQVTLDFESFYDNELTLSKVTTTTYVRALRDLGFSAIHGCGFKFGDEPSFWVAGKDLPTYFASLDWSRIIVIAHHAQFDGAILNWIYGCKPAFWCDTLSMARAYYPGESVSLGKLSERLGLPPKGNEVENTKGKRFLNPHEEARLAEYCIGDVDNTRAIFLALKSFFPLSEMQVIDMTIRQYTEPVLQVNRALLEQTREEEVARKAEMLAYTETHREAIMSNDKFAELLCTLGVEPPMKLSPAALKQGDDVWTFAFSKSDEEFIALKEHEDPRVVALVEARLSLKSTILETRTTRLLKASESGPLPAYYLYYGGHTGRYSGGDKLNLQNLSRGSNLRLAIEAPEGYVLCVQDLSQIEARMLACVAGQWDVVEMFANNEDVYSRMASTIFGRHVDRKKNPDDFVPGFIGKAVVLGCGYGLGWLKFQQMIRIGMLGMKGILFDETMMNSLGASLGILSGKDYQAAQDTKPFSLTLDQHLIHCACAKHIITTFRQNNPAIVSLWSAANEALKWMLLEDGSSFEFGEGVLLSTENEAIILPNQMRIKYPKLARNAKGEFSVTKRKGRAMLSEKVYGGKAVENCIQALSRIVITDAQLEMKQRGMRVVLHTHDEIVTLCRAEDAEYNNKQMIEIMSRVPEWCPSLPLASEGGWAKNYSK